MLFLNPYKFARMKLRFLIILFFPLLASAQSIQHTEVLDDRVELKLDNGVLYLIPLTEASVRVQWIKNPIEKDTELILINKVETLFFEVSETDSLIVLETKKLSTSINRKNGQITYRGQNGEIFLQETAGSRKMEESSILKNTCS